MQIASNMQMSIGFNYKKSGLQSVT